MAIPTTSFSAQILLIIAFLLLGVWASTFKMAGNRWRFELFSIDFTLGGTLFALVAAYTLGAFGSELGFSEHLMLASKTNEATAMLAGGLFAIGVILLLCGTALLGISFAYSIATASAVIALAGLEFAGFRALFLGAAAGVSLLVIIFNVVGTKTAEAVLPAVSLPIIVRVRKSSRTSSRKPPQVTQGMKNSSKGMIVSILSGLFFGSSLDPFAKSLVGAVGLGTFAGVLVFFVGALLSMLVLSFLLMNIPIHGGPTSVRAYFRGSMGQHILGFLGGALCAGGILLLTMIDSFPADAKPDAMWIWAAALGAGLLAIALGLSKWSELSAAPGSSARSLLVGIVLLVVAIAAVALAMDKTPPPSAAPQANTAQQSNG